MTAAEWDGGADLYRLLDAVPDGLDRKVTLFCVACCRLTAVRPTVVALARPVLEAAERHADRVAAPGEFDAAHQAALALVGQEPPGSREAAYLLAALETTMVVIDPARCVAALVGVGLGGGSPPQDAPAALADLVRDVFENPFRAVAFDPSWRTEAVVGLARGMYEARDFAAMPVLADALEDAGCADEAVLAHCRGPGPHVRGCWVVDLVLGKD